MKTLVVAQDFPWPPTLGSHLRLAQVIAVAGELGSVDVFALVPARRGGPCVVPAEVTLTRVRTVTRPRPLPDVARRLRWLASRLPGDLANSDNSDVRTAFESWVSGPYDWVWVSKAATFVTLGRPRLGPTVVDLDDLEDRKILGRLAAGIADGASGTGRARQWAARRQAQVDARRWRRLQGEVAGLVDRVVLCSLLDVQRSGLANAVVVPNGYVAPTRPAGRAAIGDPPTMLFAGSFCYGPNADAARFLVNDILPRIRTELPVVLRLVGEPHGSMGGLARSPGVTLVGQVPAMEPELAGADLVAVALRYGSGTRIKILEAFAHRIPVVSTTLGAEGLDVVDGRHLLLADAPDRFAQACVRVLGDTELRGRLVHEAAVLFTERYQWSAARARIGALAREVAAGAPS